MITEIRNSGISIIDEEEKNIDFQHRRINVIVYGNTLSRAEMGSWMAKLPDNGLENTQLNFQQGFDDSDLRTEVKNLSDLYS